MNLPPDADTNAIRLSLVRDRVRAVPDFPKAGILFRDITPVLADPMALSAALELQLHAIADHQDIERVVGIESRGFLFGMAIAERIGAGFVPVRKPGKLPAATIEARYELEYGSDALHIHADAIEAGQRVLVVDDLLATGGTAETACRLVQRLGGEVAGTVFLIELDGLGGRERLAPWRVDSVLRY